MALAKVKDKFVKVTAKLIFGSSILRMHSCYNVFSRIHSLKCILLKIMRLIKY